MDQEELCLHAMHTRICRGISLTFCLYLIAIFGHAQTAKSSISFDATSKVFRIDGGDVSYIFGINNLNGLQPIYWGSRLSNGDTWPQAHTNEGHVILRSSQRHDPAGVSPGGGLDSTSSRRSRSPFLTAIATSFSITSRTASMATL